MNLQQIPVHWRISAVMKQMGRTYKRKAKKREKRMRAILSEWRERVGFAARDRFGLKAKRAKNAWVISPGKKRG